MMNNDSALQLSNVLNQNVPVASALPEQEACSGNHQRTGRQTVKFAAAGGVRSDPHPRKNGQYRDRQWYRHSPRKTGRGYAACCRRFCPAGNPIAFDAIDNQPVDLLFALLVPADQTKTHLHTLSLVAKRLADKAICRRSRTAQSDEELYEIITEAGSSDDA